MINNPFISQLEQEIANNHPLIHITEVKDYALLLNKEEDDKLLRIGNENYINRLYDSYKSKNDLKN